MDSDQIRELFQKLISDRCSDDELDLLFKLVEFPQYEATFKLLLDEYWDTTGFNGAELGEDRKRRMLGELTRLVGENESEMNSGDLTAGSTVATDVSGADRPLPPPRLAFLRKPAWWGYAASVLLLSGLLYYFFKHPDNSRRSQGIETATTPVDEIGPGEDRAVLTLSDGRRIILDSAINGVLAEQGSSQIVKLDNGEIVYRPGKTQTGAPVYNTMSTPKGGQYRLVLPDGSTIWLNAASSVTYPVAFEKKERKIAVHGEVYLEVAEDKQRPFRIAAEEAEIVVLGTKFNLNAYRNEKWIKTTLLEGRVRVNRNGKTQTLQPGQQCLVDEQGSLTLVEHANTEEAVAWKNGFFSFREADIQTVMRQFERWYDIDVRYEGKPPLRKFEGELERGLHLSEILKILDKMGVGFRLEHRTLVVYAKSNP